MKQLILGMILVFQGTLAGAAADAGLNQAPAEKYTSQVAQKDLPRTLRWLQQLQNPAALTSIDLYSIYQKALPEAQKNHQQGISIRGSLERLILALEGLRFFEDSSSSESYPMTALQTERKEALRVLQLAKDHIDRFQFGEDAQNLSEEWQAQGIKDLNHFTSIVADAMAEIQTRIASEAAAATPAVAEDASDASSKVQPATASVTESSAEAAAPKPTPVMLEDFAKQRFGSYVEAAEKAQIAEECAKARLWETEQAPSCESDDPLECDRNYARFCKMLQ